jgi:hypothetical protein
MSDDPNTEWAVYLDYNIESMTYQPTRVVPWGARKYETCMKIEAQDELEAFRKCMENFGAAQWTS